MNREEYIKIAFETLEILKKGYYMVDRKMVQMDITEYEKIIDYCPEYLEQLLAETRQRFVLDKSNSNCSIDVVEMDTLSAAKAYGTKDDVPLLLNFAHPYIAGGSFLDGSAAQEENLCRCSTLYASLTSTIGQKMYDYNNQVKNPCYTDYMLYSPNVFVIRNEGHKLIEKPYEVSVITSPAVSITHSAQNELQEKIDRTMKMRIRKMLSVAYEQGKKTLILGAWGCGAYGNNPRRVAQYFKQVLCEEAFDHFFHTIVFAIKDSSFGKENLTTFKSVFDTKPNEDWKNNEPLVFQYPFPACFMGNGSNEPEIYLGYAQGVFMDGRPFIAELTRNPETMEQSVTYVMSDVGLIYEPSKQDETENIFETYETGLERTLYTLVLEGVDMVQIVDDLKQLNIIIDYLFTNHAFLWTGTLCNAFAMTFLDENENGMVAINIGLDVTGIQLAKTQILFQPYKPRKEVEQKKKKFRVIQGGLKKE